MTSGPKQLYLQEKGELERELKKESTTEKRKEQILKRLMRINEFLGTANIQGAEQTKAGINPGDSDALKEAKLKKPEDIMMQTGGKKGIHTKHLAPLLSEMQYIPRKYSDAKW